MRFWTPLAADTVTVPTAGRALSRVLSSFKVPALVPELENDLLHIHSSTGRIRRAHMEVLSGSEDQSKRPELDPGGWKELLGLSKPRPS